MFRIELTEVIRFWIVTELFNNVSIRPLSIPEPSLIIPFASDQAARSLIESSAQSRIASDKRSIFHYFQRSKLPTDWNWWTEYGGIRYRPSLFPASLAISLESKVTEPESIHSTSA